MTAQTLGTDITVTDMFCGAGGSSQGAHTAGLRIRIAANHTGSSPSTATTPTSPTPTTTAPTSPPPTRAATPTTTILWASPECTNHSQAKGIRKLGVDQRSLFDEPLPDEAAERSRATMWDVPRFAEHHRYRYIVVENVVDARHWVLFNAWLMAMHALSYHHQVVYLNSMHTGGGTFDPAPQSRDRMYVATPSPGGAPDGRSSTSSTRTGPGRSTTPASRPPNTPGGSTAATGNGAHQPRGPRPMTTRR